MTDTPRILFKRGDSFHLDITVTDPNSVASLAFAVVLAAAEVVLQAAIDADPYVEQDEIDAQAAVDAAQADYDASIIVDITGWTITSSLRWCGKLVTNFVVTVTDATNGILIITATTLVSELWTPREHKMDIHFLTASNATSSETMIIDVDRGPTNG